MNTPKENVQALSSREMRKLLAHLSESRKDARKLRYGYAVDLSSGLQAAAARLNSVYESVLWGMDDSAANNSVCADERRILSHLLPESIYGVDVLEVGCGSGRVSRFAATLCERYTALDREPLVLKRLRTEKRMELAVADFARPLKPQGFAQDGFSAVLLLENILGMNPRQKDRVSILKNVGAVLLRGGIAVVGFRVGAHVPDGKIIYQAMPYKTRLPGLGAVDVPGIAVNWSEQAFADEVKFARAGLEVAEIYPGQARPAGGKMHFAVLTRK